MEDITTYPLSARLEIRDWLLPSRVLPRRPWPMVVAVTYITLIYGLGGLRWDHWAMAAMLVLDCYNERTRRFLYFFLPFILTGMVYDSLRYFYWSGISSHIHVAEPYLLERQLFGVIAEGRRLTLNEYFDRHHWPSLDLVCGFAYLGFVGESLAVSLLLYFAGKIRAAKTLTWSFFVVNALGYITYFVYPAAPPWYVSQYGLGPARLDIRPNAAAGHRFDLLLGTHLFDQMYGKGIDVFGAYPSLHVAYPLLVACVIYAFPRWRTVAFLFYLVMCFSAIYLQHHYVVDVVMGTAYAVATLWLVNRWIVPRPRRVE